MPVDAEFQAILDKINSVPEPDYARDPASEIARALRATPVTIPPIRRPVTVERAEVPGRSGAIAVRIYRPDGPGPLGVLVSFHGGGWVTGTLDSDEYKCHILARESGCAVVSVDYRLAPEHAFPAAAEDGYAVTAWVADNAGSLGFDPDCVGVGGTSSGGNLAAIIPLMARDRRGPALAFQALVYPVCDDDFDRPSYLDNATGNVISRRQMMWFWDQYAPEVSCRDNPYLNPMRAGLLTGLPPARVITAEFDPLRDEGEAYARRLEDAGVEVHVSRYSGCVHGFLSVLPEHPSSTRALAEIATAMRLHLGGDER